VSELPPSPEDSDEVDALYRRASARDTGRPSESVRRAVLDHAAQLAANRAAGKDSARSGTGLRAKRQSWWRPAALGTLAAAALAGFLVVPQYLGPDAPINPTSSPAPAPTTAPVPALAPAPTPVPASSLTDAVRPQAVAPESRTAARNEAPAADEAMQNVVVTAAKKMPAEGRNRQSAQDATREPSVAGAPSALTALGLPMAPSAPSAPSAQDNVQRLTRSERSIASGTAALSYSPPPAAAAIAPAPQAMDPAAQLRRAAEIGDVGALRALLGQRTAVDARDAGGRTALMLATLHGRTEVVEALLSAGADPNAADAQGTTPLQAALAADRTDIAAALRRAGAH
jgi:Meckel syndrome type 1 protein